ncbi:protein phosphatase 2C domain-containing protein, partial [Streptomyces sp. 12297]
ATHGPLTVRAASVRGDSHRYHGEPRQDSLCVALLGEAEPARAGNPAPGLLLLAVADGVGSARRSHVGSQAVCRDLAEALDRHADELAQCVRDHDELALTALVNSALGTVGERLAQRAAAAGHRPEDYATTLRVLLVPLDPHVRGRGFFAVGDGGAALLREGRWYLDVDVPADAAPGGDGGGIIDTRTAALPTTRHTQARILGPALPGDLFVLCTDGLSTPLAGDPGIREFLADNWGPHTHIPGPVDYLWQLQYRVKSYDDDRTAVCLWEGP